MIFNKDYANIYDLVHADKDYASDISNLVNMLSEFGIDKAEILDFGCGTGTHAIQLSSSKFNVVGFDVSQDMLGIARAKHPGIKFIDSLEEYLSNFDVIISLFDVISYMDEFQLQHAMKEFSRVIKPGGLLILEGWHLPGVILSPPTDRVKEIYSIGNLYRREVKVIRAIPPVYDLQISIYVDEDDLIYQHTHTMRAFDMTFISKNLFEAGFFQHSFYESGSKTNLETKSWRFQVAAIRE